MHDNFQSIMHTYWKVFLVHIVYMWLEIVLLHDRTEPAEAVTNWSGMGRMQPLTALKNCKLQLKLQVASYESSIPGRA